MLKLRSFVALLLALVLTQCATTDKATSDGASGFGTIQFALTGIFPSAASMRIKIFEGSLKALDDTAKYVVACAPYSAQSNNEQVIQNLPVNTEYSLLIELFGDDACTQLSYRAFRGGVQADAGGVESAKTQPFYVQPYRLGQFTALAIANPQLNIDAIKRSCKTDTDCKSIHVNATCDSDSGKCIVDTLFPLNGGQRRGFAQAFALDDGTGGVAIVGGVNALIKGNWTGLNESMEIFDPSTGIFRGATLPGSSIPGGLFEVATAPGGIFWLTGGSQDLTLDFDAGKTLTAALDGKACIGAGTNCAVTKTVARWNVTANSASQGSLDSNLALPMVARVHGASGDRLLVAGGAQMPIPQTLSSLQAGATLCKFDGANVDCSQSTSNTMSVGRAHAATACLSLATDGGCNKLLIVGGNRTTPASAEVYDAATDKFSPLKLNGTVIPALLHGGQLIAIGGGNWILLGATQKALFVANDPILSGGDVPPLLITPDAAGTSATVTLADLASFGGTDGGKRLMGTAVGLADGSALLIGGIDDKMQARADAIWFGSDGKAKGRIDLSGPRFGGTAARIGGTGPLGGCVMLAGGFTVSAGKLQAQNNVEVFCPNVP